MLIKQFEDSLLELAWSLWDELGIAGTVYHHKNSLIALEELIILTAVIGESDPRLRNEALDWCSRYHGFVSLSRLKTLVKDMDVSGPFSIFSTTLNTLAHLNWPVFIEAEPLKIQLSYKSAPPQIDKPALLGLRMRSLFGVGARADILTSLLVRERDTFTSSDIAEIGYNKRSLADILDQLAYSEVLSTTFLRNQKKYEFIKINQFKTLVGQLPKVAPKWNTIIELLLALRTFLRQTEHSSPSTKAVLLQNIFVDMKEHLAELNLTPPLMISNIDHHWESTGAWLLETVNAYAHGNFRNDFKVKNEFQDTVFILMQLLYSVDDCVDGLEFIIANAKENPLRHQEIFKESYQLSLSYKNELFLALKKLLEFPFYKLRDFRLSEIAYMFTKDQLFLKEFTSSINHPREALYQYEILLNDLNITHNFIYEFKDRLKKIFFMNSDTNLLTLSKELYKRHQVLKLFLK